MTELIGWQGVQPGFASAMVVFAPERERSRYVSDAARLQVRLHFFPFPEFRYSYFGLLFDKRLGHWLRREGVLGGFDRVILHFHNANLSGLFFPLGVGLRQTLGCVSSFHGTPLVFPKPGKSKLWLHRKIGARLTANHVMLVSEERRGVRQAAGIFGYRVEQFEVVPNGLSAASVLHQSHEITASSPFRVGFVGWLERRKRWDLAAKAVVDLKDAGYHVKLVLVGTGPEESDAAELARRRPDCVEFLGRVVDTRARVVPGFDVLVLPSSQEGMPMCILEAMSAGVTVIATPVGGIPEMIDDGQNGFLVSQDDKEIGARIRGLLSNPTMHLEVGTRAYRTFEDKFGIEVCGARYLEVYERAIREWA